VVNNFLGVWKLSLFARGGNGVQAVEQAVRGLNCIPQNSNVGVLAKYPLMGLFEDRALKELTELEWIVRGL
jgi:hypothetical protein